MSQTYSQMSNLYSEDDLLRNAAGKNFRIKGFDRKAFNEAINPKKEMLADSAIGNALPACYYNLDDSFSGSGAVPPPGGVYYQVQPVGQNQTQQLHNQNFFSYMMKTLVADVKDSAYRIVTRSLFELTRDKLITKINKMGKFFDIGSSLYLMGCDSGPINRISFDWRDRLEIIVDEYDNVMAFRRYTDRKPNRLYTWLRKDIAELENEPIIPIGGRSIKIDDIDFTNDDTIKGIKEEKKEEVGGQLLRDITEIDPFTRHSGNERIITHGESETANASAFERNYVNFVISHYVYNKSTKAKRERIGETPIGKVPLYRITLPYGYLPNQWDLSLFVETLGRTIGGYLIHIPYHTIEKGYLKSGLKEQARRIEETEMERLFIPRPIVPRFGYG